MFLTIIADDFTGALDACVPFVNAGFSTRVFSSRQIPWDTLPPELEVAVVNTESRHLDGARAGALVEESARAAAAAGARCILKKTDSLLRGNVGAELAGALRGFGGGALVFAPAFPENGRFTRGGVQYLEDTPVHETALGRDPFEPLETSDAAQLLRQQAPELPVFLCADVGALERALPVPAGEQRVLLCDADSARTLAELAACVAAQRTLPVLAGCGGFAAALAAAFAGRLAPRAAQRAVRLPTGIVLVSGSISAVTLAQVRRCRERGYAAMPLPPRQKLDPTYPDSPACAKLLRRLAQSHRESGHILLEATGDAAQKEETERMADTMGIPRPLVRIRIAEQMARLTELLLRETGQTVLVVFGGDTLMSIVRRLQIPCLTPVAELLPGVVLSRAPDSQVQWIISKSGGFGGVDVMERIEDFCAAHREES